MLSVIIATFNRSNAIAEISLPSLLGQDTVDFEVLVWDASADDLTKKVTDTFLEAFAERKINLRYFRAPRKGLASQRNDAVKEALGGVIFFIDDDSEVSSNGVAVITEAFDKDLALMGAGLPITNKSEPKAVKSNVLIKILSMARRHLFERGRKGRRIIKSTHNVLFGEDVPGAAEWLTGCSMAYRKTVFDELRFDERLERFGGYALGEDADFSHRVLLHYGAPLLIESGANVIHHTAPGGRPERLKLNAAFFYNTKIIRDNFNEYENYCLISFLFGQRVLRVLRMLENGSSVNEIIAGYTAYRAALREKESRRATNENL